MIWYGKAVECVVHAGVRCDDDQYHEQCVTQILVSDVI